MTKLRPWLLGIASLITPGLGQALRGEVRTGLLWFGSAVALGVPSGGVGFPFVGVFAAMEAYVGARPVEGTELGGPGPRERDRWDRPAADRRRE